MKKLLFGLTLVLASIGCYYPSRFYVDTIPPVRNVYPDVVIFNSHTGRQYGCTPFENFDSCIYRVCVQSGWDMNNCRWQSVGHGYYNIYPAVPPYGYPRAYFEFHHHHDGCGHRNDSRSPFRNRNNRRR